MTQGEIEQLTVKTENIFSELEVRIMSDIVRRIKENGVSTASADWQISRLQQLGMSEKQIRTWIQKALEASDKEMDHIFSDEAYSPWNHPVICLPELLRDVCSISRTRRKRHGDQNETGNRRTPY